MLSRLTLLPPVLSESVRGSSNARLSPLRIHACRCLLLVFLNCTPGAGPCSAGNGPVADKGQCELLNPTPRNWILGMGSEADFLRNDTDSRYNTGFLNTIILGDDLVRNLAGYRAFSGVSSAQSDVPRLGTVDISFTDGATADVQIDFSMNIGATKSAPDLNPFVGGVARILDCNSDG
jgi:hypothetical protein